MKRRTFLKTASATGLAVGAGHPKSPTKSKKVTAERC